MGVLARLHIQVGPLAGLTGEAGLLVGLWHQMEPLPGLSNLHWLDRIIGCVL